VGVTCALCHSNVDDSLTNGVGKRLDGWANTDLNVGAIVALSPALDEATKAEFRSWGPGKYDPRHHAFDGQNIIPLNSPSVPVVIPPIYDRRIGLFIKQKPDLVTPKLAALLDYQLSLQPPRPPRNSFDPAAAERGKDLFRSTAGCATCHQGRNFTDVLSGPKGLRPFLHDPAEVGMDPVYASRSATGKYRTTPLRALWQHAPYFHDGSARDLTTVVEHYDTLFKLKLTPAQKSDLVEYLKSL
jgi:mono/diheme cytochrome c family protein